jgi:hypothetical protein
MKTSIRPNFCFKILLVTTATIWSGGAFSNQSFRPTAPAQLGGVEQDKFVEVQGAKVAWANYDALRRDFSSLKGMNEVEIDKWILQNYAFISETQLSLQGIRNSQIPRGDRVKVGHRPFAYNRAAVLTTNDNPGDLNQPQEMVDIKGIGLWKRDAAEKQLQQVAESPDKMDELRTKDHSDGLMSLGEAIAEVTRQSAVQMLFDMENVKNRTAYETIESYFVVSLPFEILKDGNRRVPAALYGRQVNWSRAKFYKSPTSVYRDRFGGKQHDGFGAAIDFGAVLVNDSRLAKNFGSDDPSKEIDLKTFDAQKSKPWLWGHETAEAFYYRNDVQAVKRHVDEMLAPIKAEWESIRQTAEMLHVKNSERRIIENFLKTAAVLPHLNASPHYYMDFPLFVSDEVLVKTLKDALIEAQKTLSPSAYAALTQLGTELLRNQVKHFSFMRQGVEFVQKRLDLMIKLRDEFKRNLPDPSSPQASLGPADCGFLQLSKDAKFWAFEVPTFRSD